MDRFTTVEWVRCAWLFGSNGVASLGRGPGGGMAAKMSESLARGMEWEGEMHRKDTLRCALRGYGTAVEGLGTVLKAKFQSRQPGCNCPTAKRLYFIGFQRDNECRAAENLFCATRLTFRSVLRCAFQHNCPIWHHEVDVSSGRDDRDQK